MDNIFEVNKDFVDNSQVSKVFDGLFMSGSRFASNHDYVRALGITAIVNLTPEDFGAEAAGFKSLQIAIEDAVELDPNHLTRFLAQMDLWAEAGESILVHCHAGMSRTPSFVIAWALHQLGAYGAENVTEGWDAIEAQLTAVRPIIMPHYLLKRAVIQYFSGGTLRCPAAECPGLLVAGELEGALACPLCGSLKYA